MPGKSRRKRSDIVKISGSHKARKGDKALVIKSGHTGWHFRRVKDRK